MRLSAAEVRAPRRSGVDGVEHVFRRRDTHRQYSGFLFGVDIQDFAEGRFHGSHGIAQFVKPIAPELLDRRNLFGLSNLALDISAERGYVEAAEHGGARVDEIDTV